MSLKQRKLTATIAHHIGRTDFRVWYEPARGPLEMEGYTGGWYVEGNGIPLTPLGLNIHQACEAVPLLLKSYTYPTEEE